MNPEQQTKNKETYKEATYLLFLLLKKENNQTNKEI